MKYADDIYDIDKDMRRIKPTSDIKYVDIDEYQDIFYILCKAYKYDEHISENLQYNNRLLKKDTHYQNFLNFRSSLIRSFKNHPSFGRNFDVEIDKNTGTEDLRYIKNTSNLKIRFIYYDYPECRIEFRSFLSGSISTNHSDSVRYSWNHIKDNYTDYDYYGDIKLLEMPVKQFIKNIHEIESRLRPAFADIENPKDFLRRKEHLMSNV